MKRLINLGNKMLNFTSNDNRQFILNERESRKLDTLSKSLANSLIGHGASVESNSFASSCEQLAFDIPKRLRNFLKQFAMNDSRLGYVKISGILIDDETIGNTPYNWDAPWSHQPYLHLEVMQCLISSVIGGIFGWKTQENGRFLRHIVPIEKDHSEQLGGSSSVNLLWHTEEAFHPMRADYFSLMCYRNNEQAMTNLVFIDDLELDNQTIRILREKRFIIEPDKSHLPEQNKSIHWQPENKEHFNSINNQLKVPTKCSILYGPLGKEYMVVDEAFCRAVDGDEEANHALENFYKQLYLKANNIIMQPGDLLIIDNLTVAHGRSLYKPNYGPKQRWLRRVNIANRRRVGWEYMDPKKPREML